MRVIDPRKESLNFPGVCVFTGTGEDALIDTDCWLNARQLDTTDPYGYVSVGFVKAMAREVGMVDAAEVERLKERFAAQDEKIAELEALADAMGLLEAQVKEVAA